MNKEVDAQKAELESPKEKERLISLAPLDFEVALAGLLQVKPVDNKELAKPKKKSKPKTKK